MAVERARRSAVSKKETTRGSSVATRRKTAEPRSLAIASRGVKTGNDFASLMSALMSDLIEGRVTPQMGNATCNAGGKLLKVVEMQYKYGTQEGGTGKRILTLALEAPLPA